MVDLITTPHLKFRDLILLSVRSIDEVLKEFFLGSKLVGVQITMYQCSFEYLQKRLRLQV